MRPLWLLLVALVACSSPPERRDVFAFPAPDTVAYSPDSQWTVTWRPATAALEHRLYLRERGDGALPMLTFPYAAKGLWNSNGRYLLVVDSYTKTQQRIRVIDMPIAAVVMAIPSKEIRIPALAPQPAYIYVVNIGWVDSSAFVVEWIADDSGQRAHRSGKYRVGMGLDIF